MKLKLWGLTMKTKRVLLLQEDDCSPDARNYFIRYMEKDYDLSFKKIKELFEPPFLSQKFLHLYAPRQ